jgi:hypothetical protein
MDPLKLSPGDYVVLERLSVDLLFDSFQLSSTPFPSYASEPAGVFNDGEVGYVLRVIDSETSPHDRFVMLLAPCGVGWLNAYYLEKIE